MKNKILPLLSEFENNFKERNEEISGAFLALLSGEHVLFLGPPGTAKSLLTRKVCEAIEGGSLYYYLLTKYTTPDEIFGPLSLKALQQDEFSRRIEGYLPTAHIAFLDEIFKANSSILNSLLTILNERKFHNGRKVLDIPLLSVFGASNELPEKEESLEALYDRFLFRYFVSYVQDETNFKELIYGGAEDFEPSIKITVDDIREVQRKSKDLNIDEDVEKIILELRKEFGSKNIQLSDRRWKKIIRVMKVASASLDRGNVDRTMVLLLQHLTWDKPEQKEPIRNILIDLAISGGVNLDKLKKDADNLYSLISSSQDYDFPKPIKCPNCDRGFKKWKTLEEHVKQNPGHRYEAPDDRYSYGSSLLELVKKLKKEHKWEFVSTIPEKNKKLYENEIIDLKGEFSQAKQKLDDERERLKELLYTNIWVSDKDRNEVLYRHENKIKLLQEIDGVLKSTEANLLASTDLLSEISKIERKSPSGSYF